MQWIIGTDWFCIDFFDNWASAQPLVTEYMVGDEFITLVFKAFVHCKNFGFWDKLSSEVNTSKV